MPSLKEELKAELAGAVAILRPDGPRKAKCLKLAVLRLAGIVRRASRTRATNLTRSDARGLIEETIRMSDGLAQKLGDETLLQILRQGVNVRADLQSWAATEATLHQAQAMREYLSNLSLALGNALVGLELSGRAGRSGAFQKSAVSAAAVLVIYAQRLFVELKLAKMPPIKRTAFLQFLDHVWVLAIRSKDAIGEWDNVVKIATRKRRSGVAFTVTLNERL